MALQYKKRFTLDQRMKYPCGWTSEALAWQAESDRRMWLKEHNPERTLRDWIRKYSVNEFSVQSITEDADFYVNELCKPANLSENYDGFLHDGDAVQLSWMGSPKQLLSMLPDHINENGQYVMPVRAVGSEDCRNLLRNVLLIHRKDQRIPASVPIMYDECIYISCVAKRLMLHSEMKSYDNFALLSGNQEVCWSDYARSSNNLWRVKRSVKREEKSSTKEFIPVNVGISLNHVSTNKSLVIENYRISTILGSEYEVSAKYCSGGISDLCSLWMFKSPYCWK